LVVAGRSTGELTKQPSLPPAPLARVPRLIKPQRAALYTPVRLRYRHSAELLFNSLRWMLSVCQTLNRRPDGAAGALSPDLALNGPEALPLLRDSYDSIRAVSTSNVGIVPLAPSSYR
jgi:hypothetical protein